MKKNLFLPLLALSLLCPAAAQAAERPYELTFTSEGYRENHVVYQKVWEPWMQEVEKRSNGRLRIVYYTPGSICTSKDVPDAVVKGRVDIGHSLFGANPGLYGYSDTGEANISGKSSLAASMGFYKYVTQNDWVKSDLDNSNTKLLTIWSTGPMMLTSNAPIRTVEDLKGKKDQLSHFRSGRTHHEIRGGTYLCGSPGYLYEHSARSDGHVAHGSYHSSALQLYEVLTEILDYPIAPGYHYMVMNRSVWDSLPPDLQKILEETTGEAMSRQIGLTVDAAIKESVDYVLSNNKCHMNEMSAEEQAKMAELLYPFREQWIAGMEERGLTRAREAIELFEKCMEEANATYAAE